MHKLELHNTELRYQREADLLHSQLSEARGQARAEATASAGLRQQLRQMEEQVGRLEQECEQQQAAVATLQAELAGLRAAAASTATTGPAPAALRAMQVQLKELQAAATAAREETDNFKTQRDVYAQRNVALQQQLAAVRADLSRQQALAAQEASARAALQAEIAGLAANRRVAGGDPRALADLRAQLHKEKETVAAMRELLQQATRDSLSSASTATLPTLVSSLRDILTRYDRQGPRNPP